MKKNIYHSKTRIMKMSVLIIFIITTNIICSFGQGEKITIPLRFDHYYTYEQITEALKAINTAYPDLTKLDLIGKSEENREIWALTINNKKTGEELDKPGVYLDGNIHGNELQASEVCLYFAEYLLKNFGKNENVTKLINKNTYYIIPVVNVDGRYHFFKDANTPSSNRSIRVPKDDDRDGLFNEDFPDDLDGDGNICQMRKKDPFGQLKTDPEDSRLMIRTKPDEKGEWSMLGQEGIDNDGDGRINEDAEGYFDGNRNLPFHWMPEYVQSGAGKFPLQASGLKAITEFIEKRSNIIIAFAFHNSGGMFLRGPGSKGQGEYPAKDVETLDYLGKNAEKIVPGYRYLISWKDLYTTYGDFTELVQNLYGAFTIVTELTRSEDEAYSGNPADFDKKDRNDQQRERLKFNDYLAQGSMYVPWKPYKHPQYGDIEIGGWVKFSSRLPQTFMLEELVHRNASAVMFCALHTPEVSIDVFEIQKTGSDLYQVRVRLENSKMIPSMTVLSLQKKLYPQDILKVSGNVKVVAGGKLINPFMNEVTYKEYKPEIQFLTVPGLNKVEYQFLISGKGNVTFDYTSWKAGKLRKTVELK